jgi:hypothetical protein
MNIFNKMNFFGAGFYLLLVISRTLAQPQPVDYVNPIIGTAPLSDPKYAGNNPVPGEQIYTGTVNPGTMVPDPNGYVCVGRVTGYDRRGGHTRGSGYHLYYRALDKAFAYAKKYGASKLAARLVEPKSGRIMEVRTTQPAVQLYTGNHLGHIAVCLETQHCPDAIHHLNFPLIVVLSGEPLKETTVFTFLANKPDNQSSLQCGAG